MDNRGVRPRSPAAGAAADQTMFTLLRTAHALEERLEEALSAVGLSAAKYGVLSKLAEARGPLMLSELASRLSCVRSNITQLVDRLEADGLVRRIDDPADRRSVKAVLTPLGEEQRAAGARQLRKVQREFAAALSETDRAALGRVLAALR